MNISVLFKASDVTLFLNSRQESVVFRFKGATGIPRCGKSGVLKICHKWLLEQEIEDERTIPIHFEELTDYGRLYSFLKERLGSNAYILSSEIATLISGQCVQNKIISLSLKNTRRVQVV